MVKNITTSINSKEKIFLPITHNNPINPSSDKIPVICLNHDFWDAWD